MTNENEIGNGAKIVLKMILGQKPDGNFTVAEIAEIVKISEGSVRVTLKKLVAGEIVSCDNGKYSIRKDPKDITLYDIMTAVEAGSEEFSFGESIFASITETIKKIRASVDEEMKGINFSDLVEVQSYISKGA